MSTFVTRLLMVVARLAALAALEAEKLVLRQQLIVLRRKSPTRVRLGNFDRLMSPLISSSFAPLRMASYCSIHWLYAKSLALSARMRPVARKIINTIAASTTPSVRPKRHF